MRKYLIIIVCLLAHNPAVLADDKEKTMVAAAPTQHQWQHMSPEMLSNDYARSTDNNRQIIQQRLAVYSNRALARAGVYAPAVGALGAAMSLAVNDRRYNLNDSKTVGFLLKDSASSHRAVLLEFRTDW